MSDSTIGVALCTYNGAAYLRAQLDSIAAQTRIPDQMVILNDRSADGTVQIAREFARQAPFPVEVTVNERNLGYAANFERAVRCSEGDLIALSDQDDVWHAGKLEKIAAVFARSPQVGLVFSDAEVVDANLAPLGFGVWEAVRFSQAKQAEVRRGRAFEVLLRGNVVTGATMVFRARYRDLVLPVEAGLHDAWIALLISAVAEVEMIPEPLVHYRQHGRNQIGAENRSRLQRLSGARRMPPQDLQRLQRAAHRLLEGGQISPQRASLLQGTIEHFANRIALPESRMRRLKPILRDLWTGSYRRFSGTSKSALHDVLAS